MYLRTVHAEHDIPTLRAFIRANPLGVFTTAIESPISHFLQSSHIPWILDVSDEQNPGELGKLRGHMGRANPQAKAIIHDLTSDSGLSKGTAPRLSKDVLVLFNAPEHHYVTPKFYTETKPSTGKVAPTWNYVAVQVYGRATIYFDSQSHETDAFLSRTVADLTQLCETSIMGYENPWSVDDAPESFMTLLKKAIIGIEIEITDMGGKWKMSQEMKEGDHKGVVQGFETMGTELGKAMADIVRERGELAEKRKS
ncbi:negative transcriptional regulator [Dendrothele bispora CBS 962.96]|uniref:Negative transcriptional regulator n=1 Tax=Dendrothele bispora (strain CBS 962.96) TaxID=1314807 RepID=A0A4S8L4I3_DENBC|nr:negative transcriptional regulator [Dendrothele bispora CBS 962.96]